IFDLFSYIIFGTCMRSSDIMNYIASAIGLESGDAMLDWNDEGVLMDVRCFKLYDYLAQYTPFHIAITYKNSKGEIRHHIFTSALGDRLYVP
ncbi:hypothetical protein PMAYCL1PPCAC_16399, partial [Pristionchus mayeri]